MRFLRTLIFFTILLAPTVEAQDALEARQECFAGNKSHPEARACLQSKAELSRIELHHAEEEMLKTLSTWNEDSDYKKRSIAYFDSSIKEFIGFRAQHCKFIASLAAGGNSAEDIRLSCFVELNQIRVNEILQTHALLNK
jgi:uncharacterized protein YecT (DUF1311 family)